MSILWIYDKPIDPQAGGTERVTHSVMTALDNQGRSIAGFLVFRQDHPRAIYDQYGDEVKDLFGFLKGHGVQVVINQIGYSEWMLKEFLHQGGERWKSEGGRIVSCLHFGPTMFHETIWQLTRRWEEKSLLQKIRRLVRILLIPVSRRKADEIRKRAYAYCIEQSDSFVILSETHRQELLTLSGTTFPERVRVIPNPNTFAVPLPKNRLPEKRKVVLIVSRLEEAQKRISLALKAWQKVMDSRDFRDWTLQVVGDGEFRHDYVNLVSKRQIPNVEFIGRADPEPYYEASSIYLHTAIHEGWGLTITEAMQKGVVPIVMNSCPVFGDFIENGYNGMLVEDGNVEAFSQCILELMAENARRNAMAVHAIDSISRNSLTAIVSKWIEIVS